MKIIDSLRRKAYDWIIGGRSLVWSSGYPSLISPTDESLDANTIIQSCLGWVCRNYFEPVQGVSTFDGKGGVEFDATHELAQLLLNPNPAMSGRRLQKALIASRYLDGNAYADIIKDRTGTPRELVYIPHNAIRPESVKGDANKLSHYVITLRNGTQVTREPDEVLHLADGIDPVNPLKGYSQLKSAIRMVLTDNAASAYSERIMRNLGVIGLMVSPSEKECTISDADRGRLTSELNQRFTGEGQGSTFVASRGVKVEQIGIDPDKMAIREIHRIPEERITAIFGLAAIVVGLGAGLDRSTFANMAEAREAATEQLLVPLWSEIDADLTAQLGPMFGLAENQRVSRDLSSVRILQEDENKKWERLGKAYQAGGIKRSEFREALGFESSAEDEIYFQQPTLNDPVKALKAEIRERSSERRRLYDSISESDEPAS